jgi:hypothetical protein
LVESSKLHGEKRGARREERESFTVWRRSNSGEIIEEREVGG